MRLEQSFLRCLPEPLHCGVGITRQTVAAKLALAQELLSIRQPAVSRLPKPSNRLGTVARHLRATEQGTAELELSGDISPLSRAAPKDCSLCQRFRVHSALAVLFLQHALRFRMTLQGGLEQPTLGLDHVLRHSSPIGGIDSEQILAIFTATLGRAPGPLDR